MRFLRAFATVTSVLAIVAATVLWAMNPELTQMQLFLRYWHLWAYAISAQVGMLIVEYFAGDER